MASMTSRILAPVLVLLITPLVLGQEAPGVCYGGGSIAGAVLGTFFATLLLAIAAYCFYKYYYKPSKDKHLVLVSDPENVKDEFAFDNPGFKSGEGTNKGAESGGWLKSQPPPTLSADGLKQPQPMPRTFIDDTYLESQRKGSVVVPLWSRDFTGLGFEVAGSMKDGIYVSSVLRGGPAHESGKIHTGDRINSVNISFRNMVYEDAVSILSYASPYEIQLEVEGGNGKIPVGSLERGKGAIYHPTVAPHMMSGKHSGSHSNLDTLEKASRQHHFSAPSGSANSTMETSAHSIASSASSAIKKMTDKIISSATLERNKNAAPKKDSPVTTLERENEKNMKNKAQSNEVVLRHKTGDSETISKPERNINKNNSEVSVNVQHMSSPPDVVIIKDGGDRYSAKIEDLEMQKKEPDSGKKGMKFGIRVLPPNIPNDGTLNNIKSFQKSQPENGNIVAEIRSIDEVDKSQNQKEIKIDNEKPKAAPVVAKRREKPAAPIPNARVVSQNVEPIKIEMPPNVTMSSDDYENLTFNRSDDLNSSGIKRDSQGIPQEIPKHMMEAALYARNNRKSSSDMNVEKSTVFTIDETKSDKKAEKDKNTKKSKGKAPKPPDVNKSKSRDDSEFSSDNDISSIGGDKNEKTELNFTDNFNENMSKDNMEIPEIQNISMNISKIDEKAHTSTPRVEKVKKMRPEIPSMKPIVDDDKSDISRMYGNDELVKKEISDSMNNFFEDSKSNMSSNPDVSITNLSQNSFSSTTNSDKMTEQLTTIALNSSDITIHSSPINGEPDTIDDENERKAASLGDLSKLETDDKHKKKTSQGTLERAQSLDISAEDNKMGKMDKHATPKKRKSNSVFESTHTDANDLDSNDNISHSHTHSKEPRLSLNIGNITMDGLNTFQKNRLKKASEWGDLQDAIFMKKEGFGSSESGSSEVVNSMENLNSELNFEKKEDIEKLTSVSNEIVEEAIDKALKKANELHGPPNNNKLETNLPDISKQYAETDSSYVPANIYQINKTPDNIVKYSSTEITDKKPNFEIGTYVSDSSMPRYKTDTTEISSIRLSPKLEDKLTMIYDTNIPDDIKVSRHSLVSSLERPKSDIMKKLLAQNPALRTELEKSTQLDSTEGHKTNMNPIESTLDNHGKQTDEIKYNSKSYTLLNQPDEMEPLHALPMENSNENVTDTIKSEKDFVSSINIVGATPKTETSKINLSFGDEFTTPDNKHMINYFSTTDNVVTISTDGSQPSSIIMIESEPSNFIGTVDQFKNSIEISNSKKNDVVTNDDDESEHNLYSEILSELEKVKKNKTDNIVSSSKTYLMEKQDQLPKVVETHITKLPTQRKVSVNVEEDEFGNKIITESVEETTNEIVTVETLAPKFSHHFYNIPGEVKYKESNQTETPHFTMMPTTDMSETGTNIKFSANHLDYDVVESNLTEDITKILMSKLKSNNEVKPTFTEESVAGISDVIAAIDNSMRPHGKPQIKVTQTTYKIRSDDGDEDTYITTSSMAESDDNKLLMDSTEHVHKHSRKTNGDILSSNKYHHHEDSPTKDYITEIKVSTPKSEKTSSIVEKSYASMMQPLRFGELDIMFMSNFLNNEQAFSSREKSDSEKYIKKKLQRQSDVEKEKMKKQKSTEDLKLKSSPIKFTTATYSPTNIPNKLSSSEKRLSQIEILKSNFEKGMDNSPHSYNKPSLSTKPSNIPVKLPDKSTPQKNNPASPSKIPVLHGPAQKGHDNLNDKNIKERSPPHTKVSSSNNISVTLIKSSSRNPSGK